jgi:hypothetical protein
MAGKWMGLAAAAGALVSAGGAHAAALEIQNAAVRVVVIPEARSDVSVTVVHANPRLPLQVSTGLNGDVIVDGGLGFGWFGGRPVSCGPAGPGGWMNVWGVGRVAYEDLPQIVARVPMDAQVRSGAAVFGAIGAANRLDLGTAGCGDWVVADVRDRLAVRNSGSARVRTGAAGEMALSMSGSGAIYSLSAARGLDASVSGSGGVRVGQASGPVQARVSGSGGIEVDGGAATTLVARATGSGGVVFKGVAQDVDSDLSGSGGVSLGEVTHSLGVGISGGGGVQVSQLSGGITARITGSGSLRIDQGHASDVDARISGSGGIAFDGVADALHARTSGSGSVRIGRVLGAMDTASSGSGRIVVAGR